ncbi:hypothetical protein TNIN_239961 [Trichonephila inaurata madagascariensis]|uniref:Uncharacterized protein n=1 Tax=Trichonephila inaurata madagascariensis TaxID=2747483 RepID=A0A8X6JR85_9ARAC|nr:hypothetical protein TNIN_239961 [Trichonephila inaurata madagascariensis]
MIIHANGYKEDAQLNFDQRCGFYSFLFSASNRSKPSGFFVLESLMSFEDLENYQILPKTLLFVCHFVKNEIRWYSLIIPPSSADTDNFCRLLHV